MRLDILDGGHRLSARLFMSMTSWRSGVEMADVAKSLLYRPEFLGGALLDLTAEAMRGPSFWTAGEREYMAVLTAQLHRCQFCIVSHTALTRIASDGQIDAGDPASVRPQVTAMAGLLEKVTRTPDAVAEHDIDALRDADVPDDAIIEALHVNLVWNIVNRLAHAFDYQLREGQMLKGVQSLHRFGYRFPGFLTDGRSRIDPLTTASERFATLVANLRQVVFDSPARTPPATRTAAATGDPLPEPVGSYTAKVRAHAHQVTNTDVEQLTAVGHSEDQIYEITVAAAVGAALHSLDAGLRAISTNQ